jgi:hypothetical protein
MIQVGMPFGRGKSWINGQNQRGTVSLSKVSDTKEDYGLWR